VIEFNCTVTDEIAIQARGSEESVSKKKDASPTAPFDPKTTCRTCLQPLDSETPWVSLDYWDAKKVKQQVNVHNNCFVCKHDQVPIDGPYLLEEGCIYCGEHHAELFGPRCAGCTQKIVNEVTVKAQGETWHDKCFCCVQCREPLRGKAGSGDGFKFQFHNGEVYCIPCNEEHNCNKCAQCGFPIAVGAGSLQAEGKVWHMECFTCFECGKPLVESSTRYGKMPGHEHRFLCAEHLAQSAELPSAVLEMQARSNRRNSQQTESQGPPTGEQYGSCLSIGITFAIGMQARKIQTTPSEKDIHPCSFKNRDQWGLKTEEHEAIGVEFEAYAQSVFQDLRNNAFGVSEEDYSLSLSQPLSGGDTGEGKSGSLFYFSWDKRLIIKTIKEVETSFFLKCLSDYHAHIIDASIPRQSNGNTASLLCRFLGFYSLKAAGEKVIRVIVMENILPAGCKLPEVYDLKGVLGAQRFVTEDQRQAGATLLLDRNILERRFSIEDKVCSKVLSMIKRDVRFLSLRERVDYSLLLGIQPIADATAELLPADQQWPSPESHGVSSKGDGKDEVIFMGIIDYLQPYTTKKMLEVMYKKNLLRSKSMMGHHNSIKIGEESIQISTQQAVTIAPPLDYATRFIEFMECSLST